MWHGSFELVLVAGLHQRSSAGVLALVSAQCHFSTPSGLSRNSMSATTSPRVARIKTTQAACLRQGFSLLPHTLALAGRQPTLALNPGLNTCRRWCHQHAPQPHPRCMYLIILVIKCLTVPPSHMATAHAHPRLRFPHRCQLPAHASPLHTPLLRALSPASPYTHAPAPLAYPPLPRRLLTLLPSLTTARTPPWWDPAPVRHS